MPKPIVALVGRPNVGKSTLFNRLAGARLAVTDETPGTTRDRLQAPAEWGGREFTVVDTGGIEVLEGPRQAARQSLPLATGSTSFLSEIRAQAEMAISEADVIVLLVDVTTGVTAADEQVAALLRRRGRVRGARSRERGGKSREGGAGSRVPGAGTEQHQASDKSSLGSWPASSVESFLESSVDSSAESSVDVSAGSAEKPGALLPAAGSQLPVPVLVAANKADTIRRDAGAYEFYALGLGDVIPISAMHGTGTGDLLDAIVAALPVAEAAEEADEAVKIAIVGRPNVGKSSLVNQLVGAERVIVSPVAGTTRDAIDTRLTVGDQEVVLIDTAGIRRRGKVGTGLEKYSVLRALKAIGRADVALLLIDATVGVTAQDAHIAGFVLDEAKSVVVVVNKWDLMKRAPDARDDEPPVTIVAFGEQVREELRFLDFVPVVFISAKTGKGVEHVLPTALDVADNRYQRIATGELNRLVREAVLKHPPATHGGRTLRIYYATQADVNPPTFLLFVNDPKLMHFSYERYLENKLREAYSFTGTPLRISLRRRRRDME